MLALFVHQAQLLESVSTIALFTNQFIEILDSSDFRDMSHYWVDNQA